MTLYRASITAAVIFGGLAIAVSSVAAQKRYDPGARTLRSRLATSCRIVGQLRQLA